MLIDIVGNTDICPYPLIQKGGPSFEMVKVLREFQCFFLFTVPTFVRSMPIEVEKWNVIIWASRNWKDPSCQCSLSRMQSPSNYSKSEYYLNKT